MDFLKVYQIYFAEGQLPLLEPEYTSFLNEDCTVYFENSVIADLIKSEAHLNSEYFGVVSYKLREKIGQLMKDTWKSIPNISNHSTNIFTPELFENELREHRPDVMSFQRHPSHDPISFANNFHPGFSKFFQSIMLEIGYDWEPTNFYWVSYCNFFVARGDVYSHYVNTMLIPAMEVMNNMPGLMANSGYPRPLPKNLQDKFGVQHYPFHSFIAERMFSFYVHNSPYNLKCLNY